MKITALAPWFGSNRTLAQEVAKQLTGCKWIGVGFAGGMSELPHLTAKSFKAKTIIVNDLHRHIINLATVLRTPKLQDQLPKILATKLFHPDELKAAQARCHQPVTIPDLDAAVAYFVAVWMGRSAKAGTREELQGSLSVRWTTTGGDSNTRYRSAVQSLAEWQEVASRCTFTVLCVFDFIEKVKDIATSGLYLDPPFPGPGDDYKHTFDETKQRLLAARLRQFGKARIVCRFYDHPLIRELYPEDQWRWLCLKGRKQSNAVGPEVLLVRNGPSP